MSRIATCPSCGDVLVMTMAWRRKEFVCLGCGSLWEFLEPQPADETPELLALIDVRKAEWATLSDGLLAGGVMLTSCREAGGRCGTEPHYRHAPAEEIAAHEAAAARIGERLGLEVYA